MALYTFKKEKENTLLIFDIGNGSVGGALVRKIIDKEGVTSLKITASERVEVPLKERVNFENLLKNISKATGVVAERLSQKTETRNFLMAYAVLASPWHASRTKIITLKKDKPFVFTKKIQDEILAKEMAFFKNEISAKNSDTPHEFSAIESNIINISLNGYNTSAPFDKEVNEASLVIYLTVSQKRVLGAIDDKIKTFFPRTDVSFHSFPLAYFVAIRDIFPQKNDFLTVDVSGEITDVSLARGGILIETHSFPLGRNFFFRRAALTTGKTLDQAMSLHAMFTENVLSKKDKDEFAKAISEAKAEWLWSFRKAIADLSGNLYTPGEIFLTADNDISNLFTSWISEEEFSQHSSHQKFNVISLLSGSKNAGNDQFLDIIALFAQKFTEKRC
ncbi:MAG: hypothetical protein AAB428_03285 [Patescibacteria group bacterium]